MTQQAKVQTDRSIEGVPVNGWNTTLSIPGYCISRGINYKKFPCTIVIQPAFRRF